MSNTKVMTIKLSRDLSARVSRAARRRKVSRSQVVRDAIRTMKADGPTVGDLAQDFCGVVKGGSCDRSTNPKHMKAYGR
jgi:metal-responsive CopG/Arc/MetJ family transcriptional regulator